MAGRRRAAHRGRLSGPRRHGRAVIALAAILATAAGRPAIGGSDEAGFVLARNCPPSFALDDDGRCRFVSVYQMYDAPDGFGGLRVPLPSIRDGFTPAQIDLGRYLFFDPVLSRDHDLSCAHCHHPEHGFADGLGRSVGHGGSGVGPERRGGERLARNSPSLWNVGFMEPLFWDGRAGTLEAQAEGPLFAPEEMANTPEALLATLNAIPAYRALFAQAFGPASGESVDLARVTRALTAFQASLVSFNSRYDRYAHGDEDALNAQEQRGHALFRSFVIRCSQCHTPPLFSNRQLAVIGAPDADGAAFDPGAGEFSADPAHRGAFRVPSLRNIALTAPYMHAGVFRDLGEVVDFYNDRRGHAVPADQHLHIHWHIPLHAPTLSAQEVDDLVAFLHALTDTSMTPPIPARVPSGLAVPRGAEHPTRLEAR